MATAIPCHTAACWPLWPSGTGSTDPSSADSVPSTRLVALHACPCRQLRKWHDVMQDKVVTLMGTDLVRYKVSKSHSERYRRTQASYTSHQVYSRSCHI
jgi:hypothetical protein